MTAVSIYYMLGIPVAYIGTDGVFRYETLRAEDRAKIEAYLDETLREFASGPIEFDWSR